MQRVWLTLGLAACAAWPAAGGDSLDGWAASKARVPSFSVRDLSGQELESRELAGKVVIVDFWATWCAPCIKELPDLAAYHDRLKDDPRVLLLSFNATDEREEVEDFVRRERIAFPVYLADAVLDPFEVVAFPTKLILDFRGRTPVERFRREGYTPIESLETRVREVLDGPGATD